MVIFSKLLALQFTRYRSKVLVEESNPLVDEVGGSFEESGDGLLGEVEREAVEVVALEQVGAVDDTAGEVAGVEADEAVDLASIASDAEGTGVGSVADSNILTDCVGLVLVVRWAAVLSEDALAMCTWRSGGTMPNSPSCQGSSPDPCST